MDIRTHLLKDRVVIDGGFGSMLQSLGLRGGEQPERWNLTHPDEVFSVHAGYLAAGCDIATANTFGANRIKFGEDTEEIIRAGVALARRAVDEAGHGWVAMDLGPTGRLLQPYGDLSLEEAISVYREASAIGAEAGADLILIETMSDGAEIRAAVLGAKEACDLPILASMSFDSKGKLLTGGDIRGMTAMLESLGVTAVGMNCGLGPKQMKPLIAEMLSCASIPVLCQPNAGLPQVVARRTVYNVGPEEFAEDTAELCRMGVRIIGGCCGTTPPHIKALNGIVRDIPVAPIIPNDDCVISSQSGSVVLGKGAKIIGERINPTGKKLFKAALKNGDLDYILREAVQQAEHDADILDVNVGLPGIDEAAWLKRAVEGIQSICTLPLQLDTASPAALERGLRSYNGKAMINSVSAKRESMDAVFPLVKAYGGAVVCLLLDETGIPETVEGRLRCAETIIAEAEKYGIQKKDLVMDALTMTVSTGSDNARITLETVRRLKEEYGVCTVLGCSNISFGLPQRERINAAFLSMAICAGLDACIVNPMSEALMSAYYAAKALMGQDENFTEYLSLYSGTQSAPPKTAPAGPKSASAAVLQGLKADAVAATEELLAAGTAPLDIISNELMPALDAVGKGFEAGKIFLPQLLMSADAAKAAFDRVQREMQAADGAIARIGKIVLATVKGDVHDIGKNIVKVLLENYNFDVIDLGKDIAPEAVLDAVRASGAPLVGLSALMTTTVPSMEATIALLHKEAPGVKVMVGGAVLTQEYADSIGADFYGADAMASVGYAQRLFSENA